MMALAFLCMMSSRMAYLILEDDYLGYYYQVKYPVLSRSVELIAADISELTDPVFEIMPKDRYEIPQVLPRLYELLVQK